MTAFPSIACRTTAVALALSLTLAGCGRKSDEADLASLDNQIAADADPALTSALEDQILVDPALANQSNRTAVRPPETPTQGQYPVDRASAETRISACPEPFRYGSAWVGQLPGAFPVYPGARVTEAAGNDSGDCRMRVVTFASNAGVDRMLDWYRERAHGAGYSAEHEIRGGDHILAGTRGDAAYYLIVTPRRGGTDVALIADAGA